jgi:hypothetical protein
LGQQVSRGYTLAWHPLLQFTAEETKSSENALLSKKESLILVAKNVFGMKDEEIKTVFRSVRAPKTVEAEIKALEEEIAKEQKKRKAPSTAVTPIAYSSPTTTTATTTRIIRRRCRSHNPKPSMPATGPTTVKNDRKTKNFPFFFFQTYLKNQRKRTCHSRTANVACVFALSQETDKKTFLSAQAPYIV